MYYILKLLEISIGFLVSVLSLFVEESILRNIVTVLSLLVTTLNSLNFFLKSQEHWTEYRETSEVLKHEKFMFIANAGIYDTEETERYKLFVERCETIISSENINWAQLNGEGKRSDYTSS